MDHKKQIRKSIMKLGMGHLLGCLCFECDLRRRCYDALMKHEARLIPDMDSRATCKRPRAETE